MLRAQKKIKSLKLSGDDRIGADIVRRALEAPLRQIVENAGTDGSIVVQEITNSDDYNYGYNAATDKYEDLMASGVIDPTKVACAALQNAASVATLLLTTEALISVAPEKKGKKGGGEMGDMDDMGY